MSINNSTVGAAFLLCLSLLASQHANALSVRQVEIEARFVTVDPINSAEIGIDWSLNGNPLLLEDQTLQIGTGDTLRALISGSAISSAEGPGEVFGNLFMDVTLLPGIENAVLTSNLQGTVDSTGDDAFGKVGFSYACTAAFSCFLALNPNAPEEGDSATVSDIPFGNTTEENDVVTPTGRTGGIETFQSREQFRFERQLAATENPFAQFAAIFDVAAIESTAAVTLTWEVTVAPVPVPAAVWLFGSALGLLGWLRRKKGTGVGPS